jgi:hypothetical protein
VHVEKLIGLLNKQIARKIVDEKSGERNVSKWDKWV